MTALKLLFWFSVFMVFYAHLGYLLVLKVLALVLPPAGRGKGRGSKSDKGSTGRKVTLLISAYNEEEVIEDKIRNSLSLDYPRDNLEIVVISDGSDDRTNEIVKRYEKEGVVLKFYEGRIGKTRCLNLAVPEAHGEFILFSDANSRYPADLVGNILAPFEDNTVGCVTGHTEYYGKEGGGDPGSIGLYSRIEKAVKQLESRIGSCVGADGAVFAIRKSLYQPLESYDINDFVIPLNVFRQGYRGVLAEEAFCREKAGEDTDSEYRRQVRITNRTLRAIFNNADLLNPLVHGFFSFQLFSHKIAKYLVPFFLLFVFTSNLLLALLFGEYGWLFAMQGIFLAGAWFFSGRQTLRFLSGPATLAYEFLAMNAAMLSGWIKYWKSETYTIWSPVKR